MIYYCYLAAGNARRFGSNKLLAAVGGEPLWIHGYRVLKNVQNKLGGIVRVVTRTPEIAVAVGDDAVLSPESEGGKSYSVINVVRALGTVEPADKMLFLTADQPYITEETVQNLLAVPLSFTKEGGMPLAAVVSDGEHSGNPVVFAGCLISDFLMLTGDEGGKTVLSRYPSRWVRVAAPARELSDIDTPADIR